MHTEYLQSLRYKLQKRIRRAKKIGFEMYISVLQQLWQFLDSEPAFVALQTELAARCPNAESVADAIIKGGLENAARQMCEWFWRNDLFRAWQASSRGEKTLAMKLYEFLFTEGIHIQIEPWSASARQTW